MIRRPKVQFLHRPTIPNHVFTCHTTTTHAKTAVFSSSSWLLLSSLAYFNTKHTANLPFNTLIVLNAVKWARKRQIEHTRSISLTIQNWYHSRQGQTIQKGLRARKAPNWQAAGCVRQLPLRSSTPRTGSLKCYSLCCVELTHVFNRF